MQANIVYYKVCDVIQSCKTKDQLIVAGRYAANFLNLFSDTPRIEDFRRNINLMISSKLRLVDLCANDEFLEIYR